MERRPTPEQEAEAEVVVVDMRERRFYDRKLLTRFYDELMVPAFGQFEDELESLDSWVEHFEAPQQQQQQHSAESESPTLHVLLVLRLPSADANDDDDEASSSSSAVCAPRPPVKAWREVDSGAVAGPWWGGDDVGAVEIVGGTACEYFRTSNCGILTYTATHTRWQRQGIAGLMTRHVLTALQHDALAADKTRCEAVFLVRTACPPIREQVVETNDPELVSSDSDVMDPLLRHRVLQRLGWWILDFKYVQPALSEQQQNCHTLKMAVHASFLGSEPLDEHNGAAAGCGSITTTSSKKGVASRVLQEFVREFFACLKGEAALACDPDYATMLADLSSRSFVPTA